jgi:hypothetical protein
MSSWARTISEPSREDDFAAHVSTSERRIHVSLTGMAEPPVKGQLDRFLRDVHIEAQRCLAEEVTVDVRRLEYMDPSCLKCLVWWISTVQEQADDGRYRIVFVSSPSVYWQRRSLNALACLANEIISIHVQ